MTTSFGAPKDPRFYEPGTATSETGLQRGQNPTLARWVAGVLLPQDMGTAALADRAPQDMSLRSALPKDHLAGLVGAHGVPQLSVGGSNRR